MAATSLKLPDSLKKRIELLAASAQKTPHAFMVEALSREADRMELRARFAADAAMSEAEAMASGKAIPLADAFDYLERKLAGGKVRKPRARSWRASK
jgi:predicted transcriptional regulator